MKLQKNTLLALCGVLEFASEPGRQFSSAEIAQKYGASPHHLAKVLGKLRRAGGGGYRFCGNAKRVTLLDVIALFETIGSKAPRAPRRDLERAVDQVLAEIDETARATFGSITLETMLKLAQRARPGGHSGYTRRRWPPPRSRTAPTPRSRSATARASRARSSPRTSSSSP